MFDIHTHRLDAEHALVNLRYGEELPGVVPEYYSVGIHPWDADRVALDDGFLRLAAEAHAIGECGLDKPCGVNIDKQEEVFREQAALANDMHKPVIVHCVRAYGQLAQTSRFFGRHTPWIIHSCYASREWIEANTARPFFFSVSPAVLSHKRAAEVLQAIPLDRLFLETDESPVPIFNVYERTAALLQISVADLQRRIAENRAKVLL